MTCSSFCLCSVDDILITGNSSYHILALYKIWANCSQWKIWVRYIFSLVLRQYTNLVFYTYSNKIYHWSVISNKIPRCQANLFTCSNWQEIESLWWWSSFQSDGIPQFCGCPSIFKDNSSEYFFCGKPGLSIHAPTYNHSLDCRETYFTVSEAHIQSWHLFPTWFSSHRCIFWCRLC